MYSNQTKGCLNFTKIVLSGIKFDWMNERETCQNTIYIYMYLHTKNWDLLVQVSSKYQGLHLSFCIWTMSCMRNCNLWCTHITPHTCIPTYAYTYTQMHTLNYTCLQKTDKKYIFITPLSLLQQIFTLIMETINIIIIIKLYIIFSNLYW